MAKTKVHGEYLDPSVISAQTEVTAVGSDHMLIFDATDNALKKALLSDLIETVGSTPTFTSLTVNGDINLGDNDKAIFGAGSDLQIYHTGSASVIQDSGDGSLFLQGESQIVLGNVGNAESYAVFNTDGAVQLRHNNLQKFTTTSTGIDVTGVITSDGLTLQTSENTVSWASGNGVIEAPSNLYLRSTGSGTIYLQDNVDVTGTTTTNNLTIDDGVIEFDKPSVYGFRFLHNDAGNDLSIQQGDANNANYVTRLNINSSGNLQLGTTSSSQTILQFLSATNGANTIHFGDGSSADAYRGYINYNHTGDRMEFATSGTERMRIDSAGRVGLGSQITSNQASTYDSRANDFVVSGGGDTGITIAGGSSEDIRIVFTANGTTGLSKGSFTYDNANDTLAVETGGSQRIRIDSDGLKFGSDSAAANALDDYEEGTWTPAYQGNTGLSSVTGITSASGTYIKVGNMVHIAATFTLNGSSSNSIGPGDSLRITGQPFQSSLAWVSQPGTVYCTQAFTNLGGFNGACYRYSSYFVVQFLGQGNASWSGNEANTVHIAQTFII